MPSAEGSPTRTIFASAEIASRLKAKSYAELLDELGAFASNHPGVADVERFAREVSSLGAEDTIPLGGGAFIPHLRSSAVTEVVMVLGVAGESLRVPAETGEETRGRVFALVAAPPDLTGQYLETVATAAHALRTEGVIEAIHEAPDADAIASLGPFRRAKRVQMLSVVDIMDPAGQRVYPDMDLRQAARLVMRSRHPGLPVVNQRDEVVGMLSETSLVKAFLPGHLRILGSEEGDPDRESSERTVKDVMSRNVLCLPTGASVSEAASIIVNKDVDPLPLTREGKWVGLISRRSLIRKLLQF